MKTTLALGALFILILVGGYFLMHTSSQPYNAAATQGISSTTTMSGSAGTSSEMTQTSEGSTTTASTYTAAQVATHDTQQSCWSSINGNVYNLTSWISQHPGGAARILSICGKDGTSAFEGQHGNDSRAQGILATFKIGTLAS